MRAQYTAAGFELPNGWTTTSPSPSPASTRAHSSPRPCDALSRRTVERPRVIVDDDGSTDQRPLDELERLPEVELVRQGTAGVASAQNTALERIRTPYALVIDADDILPARAITHLREPLERDWSLGFGYGQMHFFGD